MSSGSSPVPTGKIHPAAHSLSSMCSASDLHCVYYTPTVQCYIMMSRQAEGYTVTPDRRVRSGLREFVREVQRSSLRKKKLDNDKILDQDENNSMIRRCFSQAHQFQDFQSRLAPGLQTPKNKRILITKEYENLHVGSYKKLKSPIFYARPCCSPQSTSDKENERPETPTATILSQKKRRRSSLFTPSSLRLKMSRQSSVNVKSSIFPAVFGQGRSIPLKQGTLYKKCLTHSWVSGEWVSKYVTLTGGGCLAYYPSLSAYLDMTSGKEIMLHTTTVKIPGQNPTGVKCEAVEHCDKKVDEHESDDEDKCFEIVSLAQQRWLFACSSRFERDEWVRIIETEIKIALQGSPGSDMLSAVLDPGIGNSICVDCGAAGPEWGSVNLGIVMCIECSGIHRALGSHVSQVRSLFLDCLAEEHVARITAVGNQRFNQERALMMGDQVTCFKANLCYDRVDRETFIRKKYKDYFHFSDTLKYSV